MAPSPRRDVFSGFVEGLKVFLQESCTSKGSCAHSTIRINFLVIELNILPIRISGKDFANCTTEYADLVTQILDDKPWTPVLPVNT